jgi:hypothetical protein
MGIIWELRRTWRLELGLRPRRETGAQARSVQAQAEAEAEVQRAGGGGGGDGGGDARGPWRSTGCCTGVWGSGSSKTANNK